MLEQQGGDACVHVISSPPKATSAFEVPGDDVASSADHLRAPARAASLTASGPRQNPRASISAGVPLV